MRLLIYSSPPYSDSDFPLIKALRECGHEVYYIIRLAPFMLKSSILDFGTQPSRNGLLAAAEFDTLNRWSDYIDISRSYVSNDAVGKTGVKSFKLFLEELRLIKRIKPEAVYHIGLPYVFQLHMLHIHRKNSAVVIHDPMPHTGEDKLRDRAKRRLLPIVCKHFILLNKRQVEMFCNYYKVSRDRVTVSSLGPYDCYRRFRSERKIGGRFIFFWGRLSEYKGIDYAIQAFTLIKDRFPDVRLVIAGAGPVCFDIEAVSAEPRIEFIHRYLTLEEVADYASQCLFVVCPYTDATQSGVIQTAFAMGAPVVATDVGNFADVVHSGMNGVIIPPCDSEALAEAFYHLLAGPDVLGKYRKEIAEEFADGSIVWHRIAEDYTRIHGQ